MKKTFVLMTALAISCATVNAQKTTFGIKAGAQQNTIFAQSKEGDKERMYSGGTGFHVGAFADLSLNEQFSVQPQLLFNSKSIVDSKDDKTNIYAIDIPVNFLYKHQGFFAGLGPNFSYGLSAKNKVGSQSFDLYKKHDLEGGGDASVLKRFELGANATLGYQFKNGLLLSANYMRGLTNIIDIGSDNGRMNTRYAGLSIGYVFGK